MHRSLMINFHFLCDISGYVLVINILYINDLKDRYFLDLDFYHEFINSGSTRIIKGFAKGYLYGLMNVY